ncbi:MAG TPA: PaaI family thioesterase [Rhizomicrobium sp.]
MIASVFDRFALPPCARHLGWTLLDYDAARGWARLGFTARPEFLNPAGVVQGGFVAAMLDDTMGPTVMLATDGHSYTVTLNLNVSYLAPARAGGFVGEGRILRLGKTVAFLAASLHDARGDLVATATANARLVPVEKLGAAA